MERTHSFGYWLRRRRKALDLTQNELAQRVSCSLDLIQKIEADARRPSRQLAERLAESLGLDVAERAAFVQAARAERSVDQLAQPSQSIEQSLAKLPQGTITFLFTDIEGSSRLWEQHRQTMASALARHDTLLKEIVKAHGGVVFKTVGDSVLAAFAHAPHALAAGLATQRAVSTAAWELPEPPRVRIVLHSGSAEVRAGDYFGPALNRAAGLLAVGHGGQILLSLATEQLVREQLPPDVGLHDLGTHRLRDLSLPEQIFQLIAPDLPAIFPALNTLDARRTNLPAQPTMLLGREQEVATIAELLQRSAVRLVTLTGPGGVGKTRLSLQVAADLLDDFADGVYFVDLAPVRDPELVVNTITAVLSVREASGRPPLSALKAYLGEKRLLLVLDNFEQVLDAAPLVAELLTAAPQLKVLATSREALHLRGERELPLPPLTMPDRAALPPLELLSQYAAVALFIERAVEHTPGFQVTNENAPAVAEICIRLDGLPLAIELAAARLKLFAPEALLTRLSSRLTLLTGGARDLPARQQTIRATIAWSYDLLDESEQVLFRRLGVFVGGWTMEAAEAVCESEVVDRLAALVDKSLVRLVPAGEEPRFTMLETIREFALERLEASGEAEELRRQHAKHYFAYAETRQEREELLSEYDNLQAALAWSQTTAGDPEMAMRLAGIVVEGCLVTTGYEGIRVLQRSLNHPRGVGRTRTHVSTRLRLAGVLGVIGDRTNSERQHKLALELAQELGEIDYEAEILHGLGWVAREQGDTATAWTRFSEALALFRAVGHTIWIASSLNSLAEVAIMEEDAERAEALLVESQKIASDTDGVGWGLNHLGHVAQLRGQFARAAELHQESLTVFGEDYKGALVEAYQCLGECALGLGRVVEGVIWLAEALRLSYKVGQASCTVWCLAGLGTAAALTEQPERAARLWGAAAELRETIGCRPAPATRATYERAMAKARAQLSEEAFAIAWATGRGLTLDQALAYALEGCDLDLAFSSTIAASK